MKKKQERGKVREKERGGERERGEGDREREMSHTPTHPDTLTHTRAQWPPYSAMPLRFTVSPFSLIKNYTRHNLEHFTHNFYALQCSFLQSWGKYHPKKGKKIKNEKQHCVQPLKGAALFLSATVYILHCFFVTSVFGRLFSYLFQQWDSSVSHAILHFKGKPPKMKHLPLCFNKLSMACFVSLLVYDCSCCCCCCCCCWCCCYYCFLGWLGSFLFVCLLACLLPFISEHSRVQLCFLVISL